MCTLYLSLGPSPMFTHSCIIPTSRFISVLMQTTMHYVYSATLETMNSQNNEDFKGSINLGNQTIGCFLFSCVCVCMSLWLFQISARFRDLRIIKFYLPLHSIGRRTLLLKDDSFSRAEGFKHEQVLISSSAPKELVRPILSDSTNTIRFD